MDLEERVGDTSKADVYAPFIIGNNRPGVIRLQFSAFRKKAECHFERVGKLSPKSVSAANKRPCNPFSGAVKTDL
jgi:hypothetical protein